MTRVDDAEYEAVDRVLATLLFDTIELPLDVAPPHELAAMLQRRTTEAVGSGSEVTPTFFWHVLRSAIDAEPSDEGARRALVAAKHLLVLVEDDDTMASDGPAVVKSLGTRAAMPLSGETYLQMSRRHKGFRHAYAAYKAGYSVNHNVFRSGGPARRAVLGAVVEQFSALLASDTALVKQWRAYQKTLADAGKITFMPAIAGGWGPRRDTWTHALRPGRAVLNSRHDHPVLGSALNFFRLYELLDGQPVSSARSHMVLEPGRTYRGLVFVSNDADPGSDAAPALNVRVHVQGPGRFTGSARLTALVEADGVEHEVIWDSIVIALPEPDQAVALRIVPDSAILRASSDPQTATPLDAGELFGEGALIGSDGTVDGIVSAEQDSMAYVAFDFVLDKPDFVIDLEARPYGSDEPYRDRIELEPLDIVDVKAMYKNTGTVQQNGVRIVLLPLPGALRYYGDRIRIANTKTDGEWREVAIDPGYAGGLNLGSYAPGGSCYVHFRLMAHGPEAYEYRQGVHWLLTSKLVQVFTDNGSKSAGLTTVLFASTRPLLPHVSDG